MILMRLFVYFGSLKNIVISKPLYVTLLALMHAIVGLSYERIIFLQTLIVAFFPVVLYFNRKRTAQPARRYCHRIIRNYA